MYNKTVASKVEVTVCQSKVMVPEAKSIWTAFDFWSKCPILALTHALASLHEAQDGLID